MPYSIIDRETPTYRYTVTKNTENVPEFLEKNKHIYESRIYMINYESHDVYLHGKDLPWSAINEEDKDVSLAAALFHGMYGDGTFENLFDTPDFREYVHVYDLNAEVKYYSVDAVRETANILTEFADSIEKSANNEDTSKILE